MRCPWAPFTFHISVLVSVHELPILENVVRIADSLADHGGCLTELLLTVDTVGKTPRAWVTEFASPLGQVFLAKLDVIEQRVAAVLRAPVRRLVMDYGDEQLQAMDVVGIPQELRLRALPLLWKNTVMFSFVVASCSTEYLFHSDLDYCLSVRGATVRGYHPTSAGQWLAAAFGALRNVTRYPGLFAINPDYCLPEMPSEHFHLAPLPGGGRGYRIHPRHGLHLVYNTFGRRGPLFSMETFLMHVPRFRRLWPLLPGTCPPRWFGTLCANAGDPELWSESIENLIELRLTLGDRWTTFAAWIGSGSANGTCLGRVHEPTG